MRSLHISDFFRTRKICASRFSRTGAMIFIALILCLSVNLFLLPVKAENTISSNAFCIAADQKETLSSASENASKSSEISIAESFNPSLAKSTSVAGNVFYVSTSGGAANNGTINSPWDLKTAFNHPAVVKPGDTIYLRGGTYRLPTSQLGFTSKLTGTPENPIKVVSYPGEWAVIDGNLSSSSFKNVSIITVTGSFTWYSDFEITNSERGSRITAVSGSNISETRGSGIDDQGLGTKLINLIIHDTGQGISSFSSGRESEYYGNVVYNNGREAPDRLHGHGAYVQNNSPFKKFEDNLFFNGFGSNSQMYGSSEAFCRNITWIGNVMFNGSMVWSGPSIENLLVRENHFYNQHFKVGYEVNPQNTDADIQYNHFMSGALIGEMTRNVTFKNNSVWYNANDPLLDVHTKEFWDINKFTFANNTYYKGGRNMSGGQFRFWYRKQMREFAFNKIAEPQRYSVTKKSWQEDLQLDANSTYIDSAPTGTKIFLRPNKYDSRRAHIIVYNWNQSPEVSVDVSSILRAGDSYQVRNVQNYFKDITTGTYSGGQLKISMIGRTQAIPVGYDQLPTWYHKNTFPTFGVFVLIKTSN